MYDLDTLVDKFSGMIGVRQPYDPDHTIVSIFANEPSTGRYLQDYHPLCTLENLENCAPDFRNFVYQNWDAATAYKVNRIVNHAGSIWRANADTVAAETPGVDPKWVKITAWDAWLLDQYRSGIQMMIGDLLRYKKLEASNRALIDSLKLFDGIGSLNSRIAKRGRFVALEISVSRQEGLRVLIDKVAVQSDAGGNLPLYLYHSSTKYPLKTWSLNLGAGQVFSWQSLEDAMLQYFDDSHSTEGSFYLGYYEDDLAGQAIKRESTWGVAPCYGCTGWNAQSYERWSKHVTVKAVSFMPAYLDSDNLPDMDGRSYDPSTNWGINLALTVVCDMSTYFAHNKAVLADAIGMAFAVKMIGQIAYSTRMNTVPDKLRALALQELSEKDEDSFLNKYKQEIQAVSLDFSGLSSACLPNSNKVKGIIFGAA